MNANILIIDDERSICESLKFAFSTEYNVRITTDPHEGLSLLRENDFDVVLLDMRLGSVDGIDILRAIHEVELPSAVIVMTAYGSETTAVEAMKLGAFSYLTKPLDIDELKIVVSNAVQFVKMSDKVNYLSEELNKISANDTIIAESTAMRRVLQLADKIKDTDTNVLITGESGTGKELIARRIHYNGLRKNERFVVINCAAIPENLLESELFGYKKGAFTGAAANHKGKFSQADNGTLFLDEIGDMQISLQAKILRALQERVIVPIGSYEGEKVNVRMIAATNRNLKEMVKEGLFREDLYYRLNVITIETPPLRNRRDDIIPLCNYYIEKFNREQKKNIKGLSPTAEQFLMNYDFPGNVRQLANIMERAVILTNGSTISSLALSEELNPTRKSAAEHEPQNINSFLAGKTLKELERIAIIAALDASGGKKSDAAKSLGISERGLWYKIKEYNIQ